jgi:methylthioribose-1-phosphate isomerase
MAVIAGLAISGVIGAVAAYGSAKLAQESKDKETDAKLQTELESIRKTYLASHEATAGAITIAQLNAQKDISMQKEELKFQRESLKENLDFKRDELAFQKEKLGKDTDLANRKLDIEFKLNWEDLKQRRTEEKDKHQEAMASIAKKDDFGDWSWFGYA